MAEVYIIPSLLSDDAVQTVHPYSIDFINTCHVLFVENERTARRFLKQLWKLYRPEENLIIDEFEWHTMEETPQSLQVFKESVKKGLNIALISEAGCPGVADPGQYYVETAQKLGIRVRPVVGPNAILLSLMASGMNGQQFKFNGYLPIENALRIKAIKELEVESFKKNLTQIFIETPYRNNQLVEAILSCCQHSTRLCIAVAITASNESIITKTIAEWKKEKVDIHKRPAIFLLMA